jgi:hypothetical protein
MLIVFLSFFFALNFVFSECAINKEVTRNIDASTSIVRVTTTIKAIKVQKQYDLIFTQEQAQHLSFLSVILNKKKLVIEAPVS